MVNDRYASDLDLMAACVHEFGHLMVARALGVSGWVSVTPHERLSDADRWWAGWFYFQPTHDHMVRRMIGLAGLVAEAVHVEPDVNERDIIMSIELGGSVLSDSDAVLAAGFQEADVAECLSLVRKTWPDILRAAQERTQAKIAIARFLARRTTDT